MFSKKQVEKLEAYAAEKGKKPVFDDSVDRNVVKVISTVSTTGYLLRLDIDDLVKYFNVGNVHSNVDSESDASIYVIGARFLLLKTQGLDFPRKTTYSRKYKESCLNVEVDPDEWIELNLVQRTTFFFEKVRLAISLVPDKKVSNRLKEGILQKVGELETNYLKQKGILTDELLGQHT